MKQQSIKDKDLSSKSQKNVPEMYNEQIDMRILNSNTVSQKTVHSYLQGAERI